MKRQKVMCMDEHNSVWKIISSESKEILSF